MTGVYVPVWAIIVALVAIVLLAYLALRPRRESAPKPSSEVAGQQIAEQMIASFKARLTPEQEAAINEEFSGLNYEQVRARMADLMARVKPTKEK